MPQSVSASYPFPVTLNTQPAEREGSKAVPVTIAWASIIPDPQTLIPSVLVNLLSQYQTGQFTSVQACLIDNATCPNVITLLSLETGQRIIVPGFASVTAPLLCGPAPEFRISGDDSACIGSTRLFFLNTPHGFSETRQHMTDTPLGLGQGIVSCSVNAANVPTEFFPAVSGRFNRNIAITALSMTLTTAIAYGAGTFVRLTVTEGNGAGQILQDAFYPPAAIGLIYQRAFVFDPPIVLRQTFPSPFGSNLCLELSAISGGGVALFGTLQGGYVTII
jgi:hypothetical protein